MSARPQHMHDGGIVERRLRPIYDWLDNGVNKKALQEAEKVLKKSPTLQAARALKALALLRLGKKNEAQAVLDVLAEEKPSDDTTLQAMTICYRESQQLNKVCALYEAAVKSEPTSEELHSHLFMSYVRVADYRAQQRAAMALYKLAPKNPYYFWAVMSIVLQAKSTEDVTKKGILLTLAQRMVDNFIAENKMEAEQEARLYIMILELQEKWEDILKFIEGPLYSQLVPGSTAQASIPYLKKLGHWRKLNLLCKELLWDNQDRWDYYMPYFESAFELMKGADPDENCNSSVDDTEEKCHEFICELIESISSERTIRGPYLARLELKRLSKEPKDLYGGAMALCIQYLKFFAHKSCSVPDVRPYLSMIPQKEREEYAKDFLFCLGFQENSEPDNAADVQRHVSCAGAWRLAAARARGECLPLARGLRARYVRAVRTGLAAASATEFCAADGYATLAAHHYFYAAVEEQDASLIVEALSLLEFTLHNSPANFHVKLLLISLYHILGGCNGSEAAWSRLEAKHVQLASLGWLHAARLPAAAPRLAHHRLAQAHAFYTHHANDSAEHVTYAYKYGTFEKLVELGAWHARLAGCAWAALLPRERALLALQLPAPPAPPALLPDLPEHLTDNRDLRAIVSWDPPQDVDAELRARTFAQEVAYARLKDALLRAAALCGEAAAARDRPPQLPQLLRRLDACIQTFSEAMQRYRHQYSQREKISISAPLPSRIIALVGSAVPYGALYAGAMRAARAVCAGSGAGGGAGSGAGSAAGGGAGSAAGGAAVSEAANDLRRELRDARAPLAAGAPATAWQLRDSLEHLANFLEFVGVVTYIMGVCHEVVTPANSKKSKKKPNQSQDELETSHLLNELNQEIIDLLVFMSEHLDSWPNFEYESNIEEQLSKLNISEDYQCPVASRLKKGYQETIRYSKDTLEAKVKYLKSLQ